jgi:anthranilate phosphoribosyltransferase
MKKILNHLFEHKTLSQSEAEEVLTNIASAQYSDPEIAAFLTVYLMRSITVEELSGFRNALLNLCISVDLSDFETIDLCGTGGDEKNTFNISTLTSFVVAGAGAKVAKHGNYSVSSTCGSSNVMEQLGYKFTNDKEQLKRELDQAGICFLHAPLFNPAMKNVAPVRRALKIKTFFNMLGPMVNPSFPQKQMVGVFSLELLRLYSYIYQQADKQFAIVHSLDGYDEISLTSPFKILTNNTENLLSPEELDMPQYKESDLFGGENVDEAVEMFKNILNGEGSQAQNDVVVANAAMALNLYFGYSLEKSLEEARSSLVGGKAKNTLQKLLNT